MVRMCFNVSVTFPSRFPLRFRQRFRHVSVNVSVTFPLGRCAPDGNYLETLPAFPGPTKYLCGVSSGGALKAYLSPRVLFFGGTASLSAHIFPTKIFKGLILWCATLSWGSSPLKMKTRARGWAKKMTLLSTEANCNKKIARRSIYKLMETFSGRRSKATVGCPSSACVAYC